MDLQARKEAFVSLGNHLDAILLSSNGEELSPAARVLYEEVPQCAHFNPWFIAENVKSALWGLRQMLEEESMESWLKPYRANLNTEYPLRTIAVVMAGNLPVVGFHDFLCVLISGHNFLGKLSHQDRKLPTLLANLLTEIAPAFGPRISFTEERLSGFDAIIATGSNNTSRYFDYYFGKYPNIIRRNRNSLAVLSGNESKEELLALAKDIFMYFGMGCRSVSALRVPQNWNPIPMLEAFEEWKHLKDHSKFQNNYEYRKAIMLVNQIPHFDTGFALLTEDAGLSSPLSVIHYFPYENLTDVENFAEAEKHNIQCISTSLPLKIEAVQTVPLGQTQMPAVWDYADGTDTLKFLTTFSAENKH